MSILKIVEKNRYFILFTSLLIFFAACKKDNFITNSNARLYITNDSIKFDTVFTATGSITKSFKIINENNQRLLLSKIQLMGGSTSAYKLNINGVAAHQANDVELAANDSIYIFVSVNVNPNTANMPFILSDSILINYNGNDRFVQLQAYGQNANFLNNQKISGNITWSSSLPYVILGSLQVDTSATLTIPQGTKIFSHADAPFIVDGTLIINGTKNNEVVFAGDRLDGDYANYPSAWPGIYFRNTSKNNILQFAIVKNAYQAIVVTGASVNTNPKLVLQQCVIDNAYQAGILCAGSSMQANNSLISNCGNNIALIYGGNYSFINCTVASFYNDYIPHKNPVLTVNNFATQAGATIVANLTASFTNCIFWGDEGGLVDNEIEVEKVGASTIFNVSFTNSLYKAKTDPAFGTSITNCLKNKNPLFDSIDVTKRIFDFRINKVGAPGFNTGISTTFSKDLDNANRSMGLPDLGCYEKQ